AGRGRGDAAGLSGGGGGGGRGARGRGGGQPGGRGRRGARGGRPGRAPPGGGGGRGGPRGGGPGRPPGRPPAPPPPPPQRAAPTGKVDGAALPSAEFARTPASSFVAPRTPHEVAIAAIWADVLGLDRVGLEDDFFELGGHSLLATQVISRIRRALGVDLPLRDLFEIPTVAALAARVSRTTTSDLPPIARADRSAPIPLSFAQERLWFLDQLIPGDAFYNIPAALRVRGPLEIGALAQSVADVVGRHEVLRTTFESTGGVPLQVVAPARRMALPIVNLEALPEAS